MPEAPMKIPAEAIDALAQELCDYEDSDDPESIWEAYRGDAEDMLSRVAPILAAERDACHAARLEATAVEMEEAARRLLPCEVRFAREGEAAGLARAARMVRENGASHDAR